IRWFHVRQFKQRTGLGVLVGLDVSGSQAQILSVLMGLRDVENELRDKPFKSLVAAAARGLHEAGTIRLPNALLDDSALLETNAKRGMKLVYGASENQIARESQRDPDRYGPGLSAATLRVLFQETPIINKLRPFLTVCEAVGRAAYEKDAAAGVTII